MGNPYLNRDETIILTTQRIRINSTLTDVMLTNQRLILVDPGHAQFRPQTIPLTTIETVMTGEDADGNPVISLSLSALTPQGATQSKELIFSQKASGERKQERDEWVKQRADRFCSRAGIFHQNYLPGSGICNPVRRDKTRQNRPFPGRFTIQREKSFNAGTWFDV
jgi:hypothetical protein